VCRSDFQRVTSYFREHLWCRPPSHQGTNWRAR